MIFGFTAMFIVIMVGTVGYWSIEEWSFIDALYMSIITITTTGFKEVHPLSENGKLFTIIIVIGGVLTIAYTGGKAAQIIFEKNLLKRRRMSKRLETIGNHYIVCGYGRMGKQICEGLQENHVPFVVIEQDENRESLLMDLGYLFVIGDGTRDDVLIQAGVERAKGLVAVIRSDAENVFTTLSAKEINPDLFVVTRAVEEGSESKLRKAGANRVVRPYEISSNRMVQLLLRPSVMEFIDGVAKSGSIDISLEEISLSDASPVIGKTLADSPIRRDLNIIIVAIHRKDGSFIYNPTSITPFEQGDTLIAIGEQENLAKLTEMCTKQAAASKKA